jgi:hypothetical protein
VKRLSGLAVAPEYTELVGTAANPKSSITAVTVNRFQERFTSHLSAGSTAVWWTDFSLEDRLSSGGVMCSPRSLPWTRRGVAVAATIP